MSAVPGFLYYFNKDTVAAKILKFKIPDVPLDSTSTISAKILKFKILSVPLGSTSTISAFSSK